MKNETTATPEQAPHGPTYKFIFAEHLAENTPQIVEALQDCDVVALEMEDVPDQNFREKLDMFFTEAVKSEPDPAFKQAADEMLQEAEDENDTDGLFLKGMLQGLAGSDKQIVTMGRNLDQPDELRQEAQMATMTWFAFRHTQAPHDSARKALADHLTALGRDMPGREEIMANILRALPEKQGLADDKVVGVVLGATHTGVQHGMSKDFSTQRVFVGGDQGYTLRAGEKKRFGEGDTAVRSLRFNREAQIAGPVLNRIMLTEAYADTDTFMPEAGQATVHDKARATRRAETYVKNMDDEQVAAQLEEIDVLRAALLGHPASTIAREIKERLEQKLSEREQQ